MDKRNNAYLYITCFIVSIGGLLLGISANVSGASDMVPAIRLLG